MTASETVAVAVSVSVPESVAEVNETKGSFTNGHPIVSKEGGLKPTLLAPRSETRSWHRNDLQATHHPLSIAMSLRIFAMDGLRVLCVSTLR